jgi:hypothetical protein
MACQFLYCVLAVLSGVADVLRGWPLNGRESLPQPFIYLAGVVKAQSRLRETRDPFRVRHPERSDFFRAADDPDGVRSLAESTDDFIVIRMTDQDDRVILLGIPYRLAVHFDDQWAAGIYYLQSPFCGHAADVRRHSVRTEDHSSACRNIVEFVDENDPSSAQLTDNKTVMDNLAPDVKRLTVGPERKIDDIDSSNYTRAKAAGRCQDELPPILRS